jgi:hypothetical protein
MSATPQAPPAATEQFPSGRRERGKDRDCMYEEDGVVLAVGRC